MYGKTHSIEARNKMSEAVLKNNPFRGVLGSNHHAWRGGVDSINRSIRDSHAMVLWRNSVFKRDRYTCKLCNKVGGILNADHIKQLALIIHENDLKSSKDYYNCEELWDINNGRTLCQDCHKKTETWGKYIRK